MGNEMWHTRKAPESHAGVKPQRPRDHVLAYSGARADVGIHAV